MNNDTESLLANLLCGLTTIQFICENLKNQNKKKVDIDVILEITKKVLEK